MCGIAGILRWGATPVSQPEIERMTRAVNHRGPDGEGCFVRDNVALGHRRLAIIDPATGQQPLSNEDGQIWVTYNGEIYNYRELRQQLQGKGHKFSTNCDTEVIVHAYEEWGPQCVQRFRGMFAFCVADFNKQQLFLARDHFGIKPLFYRNGPDYLAFASELAALRAVDAAVPKGNLLAVELYLRFQYIPTPHTIYADTFKLPPAHYMVVDFNGRAEPPVRYWDLNFEPATGGSEREWLERVEAIIRDSVNAHLVSDVPFGVFLSGGIDSTLVACEMSQILQRPVKAFSIGFEEREYSELPYAEQAARTCGVELHTEIVREQTLEILPDLVAHYGEPFGDSSAVPTWYVSRLAREHVPMVLSGDGGDEAFAGYSSYFNWMEGYEYSFAQFMRVLSTRRRAGLGIARRWLLGQTGRGIPNQLDQWQARILYTGPEIRSSLWREEYRGLVERPSEVFEAGHARAESWDRLSYAQYLDYQTYLPCDILTKVDIASMYHGLEVRPPLVDVRVVELAATLPLQHRFGRDAGGNPVGKTLLKRILGKKFPHEFLHRPKQGFSIPRAHWFLPDQAGRKMLEEVLLDPTSRLHHWFEPELIQHQLSIHTPQHDNSNVLWVLLVLGIWLEQNHEIEFS